MTMPASWRWRWVLTLTGSCGGCEIVVKKQSTVVLQEPQQRRRTGLADTEAESFERMIDAAHALMVTYREDGITGANEIPPSHSNWIKTVASKSCCKAMVNAIPSDEDQRQVCSP